MNIKKYLKISLGIAVLAATQVSCIHDDNWDAPEITCNNKFDAPTKTMAEVVAMAKGDTITIPNKPTSEPIIFDGYVVSSDQNGNFYKTISFQDKQENPTMGMQIEINKSMNYADFPVGSHIRIKANGLVVGTDAGVVKIGTKDPSYRIGRIPQTIISRYMSGVCAGNGLEIANIVPTVVTLSNLVNADKYINTLVTVKDVQFIDVGVELMGKDPSGAYIDTDRKIEDKNKNTAVVRTDGFFKAGGYKTPNKSGDITFVVSRYNTNVQNIIRSLSDINFTKDRFTSSGGGSNPGGGVEAANFLFKGADFESWTEFIASINSSFGIKPYATQGVGLGRDGSNALQIKGKPSANDYVFTAIVNNAIPANAKKITFYVKGTSEKSLSLNVNKPSGTPAYTPFNVGNLSDSNVLLQPAAASVGNQYTGVIDTKGKWVLVTLNIEGLDIEKGTGKDLFSLKTGKDANYDLVIDNIKID